MRKKLIKCNNCIFKWWDCKNCYILDETSYSDKEVFFPSIVITIVLTRQCNLRCNYCWINFTDNSITQETIDLFLKKLLIKRKKINKIKFEFFWWEPLLELEKIKYIVNKTKKYDIEYSIVTNGFLLNKNTINFLNDNNFEVVFSVAIHTNKILDEKMKLLKNSNLKNFIINFIIEPWKELLMFNLFIKLIKIWFYKITILPVYYTKKWSYINFKNLDLLLNKISIFYNHINFLKKNILELFYIRTNKEVEFNIKKNDIELFLDYDGKIYWDYDTELRLLKDYVWKNVFNIDEIFLWDLNNNDFSLIDIIILRKKINTVYFINKISNYYKLDDNLQKLWKIIYNNNVNIKNADK